VPDEPAGEDIVGAFHTHPNIGDDQIASASPRDWAYFGHGPYPHYIISNEGIFRLTDIQEYLGPLYQRNYSALYWTGAGLVGVAGGAATYCYAHGC
jgi:proteasome lid subunit RPN8/RPN11